MKQPAPLRTSLVQMSPGSDRAENIRTAETLARRATEHDRPDLLSFPEMWCCLGGGRAAKIAAAEPLPAPGSSEPLGPCYQFLQNLARSTGTFVHGGSIGELAGDHLFNTTLLFDDRGCEIARYRKIHLFDVMTPDGTAYRESATVKAGDKVVTYDCEGVTVGCSICYDLRFPDLFQALAEKGAEMIAMPAAFTMQTGKDHWEVLLRARAIETETYVCASAQTGSFTVGNEQRHTYGHSLVADPWGHVVAKASDGVGIVSARIDPARVKKVRGMIPVAEHKVKIARS